jgi:hypothetical protein
MDYGQGQNENMYLTITPLKEFEQNTEQKE